MVYLARKRVFNWWKHNFTYLRQSSLLFSIRKFDYCVSWSSHRQRFRHVYNFPAKKGGGRLGASASPFRGFSEKRRNDEVFSRLPTLLSHFTSNICKNIRSSNLKISLRKQPTFRGSYEGQVQEFPLMTCHDHFPDGWSKLPSRHDQTKALPRVVTLICIQFLRLFISCHFVSETSGGIA